jgi:hypothetical protein
MIDAANITLGVRDQPPESVPNDRANISRPQEIDDTSASWRQIGGGSGGAGSQRAPWDFCLARLEGGDSVGGRNEKRDD